MYNNRQYGKHILLWDGIHRVKCIFSSSFLSLDMKQQNVEINMKGVTQNILNTFLYKKMGTWHKTIHCIQWACTRCDCIFWLWTIYKERCSYFSNLRLIVFYYASPSLPPPPPFSRNVLFAVSRLYATWWLVKVGMQWSLIGFYIFYFSHS